MGRILAVTAFMFVALGVACGPSEAEVQDMVKQAVESERERTIRLITESDVKYDEKVDARLTDTYDDINSLLKEHRGTTRDDVVGLLAQRTQSVTKRTPKPTMTSKSPCPCLVARRPPG